ARLATAPHDAADHKSRLQELTAQRYSVAPRYLVDTTGPDHARTFFVTATIDGRPLGRGEGRSKKQAEQAAARAAVQALLDDDEPITEDTLRETHHG
ncbi:MAG: putative dsRNA-binding protein, partial [Acidimicrobiales bacterium]|nr:putative dsRNA-binding protein [Acidimicrobiales bacterium]